MRKKTSKKNEPNQPGELGREEPIKSLRLRATRASPRGTRRTQASTHPEPQNTAGGQVAVISGGAYRRRGDKYNDSNVAKSANRRARQPSHLASSPDATVYA